MSIPLEALEAEVLHLPSADRSRLLDKRIASRAIDEAWMQEAKRRDDEIESGSVQAIPGDVVLARLRALLR
jgi:hypothetical protein